MYYLRRESYEKTIPEMHGVDGKVIPERKYMSEDRAVYKSNSGLRIYRQSYPKSAWKGMFLYKLKRLNNILATRKAMYDYSGEWFDVYDENGKVDIPQYLLDKYDSQKYNTQ